MVLLSIALVVVLTVVLIQRQQDVRQRAAEQLHTACDTTTKSKHTCSYSGSSPEYTYLSSTLYGPQLGSCPSDTVCVQSGSCIDCKPVQHSFCDKAGGNSSYRCSSSGYSSEYTYLSSTLYGPQLGNCGSGSVCVQSGSCIDCRVLYGTGNLPPPNNSGQSGGSGGSGGSGNNSGGNSNSCIPPGKNQCGAPCDYCDKDGWTCGADKLCYPPTTGGSGGTGGGTATCNGSDFSCNGKCYTGCPSGYDCGSNGATCKNSGCGSGMVLAGGDKCCPAGTPNLCSDGFCKVSCSTAVVITPDPRPSTFTLTSPNMDCNSATLSWGLSTGAVSYAVETYDGSLNLLKTSPDQTGTTYKVTGLSPSTIYIFQIVAKGSGEFKRSLSQTAATTATCQTASSGGGTASTPKKTPTTTTTNTGSAPKSSPQPPKTATPTITTQVTITRTTTPSPSLGSGNTNATISFTFSLPGIGPASENKNPNPQRTQRMINVGIINSSGAATSAQGTANFDSATNTYKGTVTVSNLAPGTYTAKIRLDNTLWKKLPDTITITSGPNTLSTTTVQLISGDIDQNNSLTIADYTSFVKCFKALPSCSTSLKSLTNFDEDATTKDDLDDLTILQQGFNTQTQGD